MYTPRHFAMSDEQVRGLLATAQTAQLVTAHEDGPVATLLPLVWRPGAGEDQGSLVFHVTRVNPVWKREHLGEALAILSGPDAYVDPHWYPSNAESPGVPTWNYVTVHAWGPLVVHDDPAWVRESVWELSDRFGYDSRIVSEEATDRLLRAIVGIELPIRRLEAKAKLNQNRTPDDVRGVIEGLHGVGEHDLAAEMESVSLPHALARDALVSDVRGRHLGVVRPRT